MPKISVLMSVYNEPTYMIELAINSILKQTLKDFEFIIINDNPTDKVIERFLQLTQKQDNRIRIITNDKNIGLQKSLNKGLKLCKARYIARMDADDISNPSRFEKQYDILKDNDIDVVSTDIQYIDEVNNLIENQPISNKFSDITKVLLNKNVIAHPSVMFNKEAIFSVGGYREIKYAEDYDLWLRLISEGYKIKVIEEKLLKYRIRESSISIKNKGFQFLTTIYVQKLFVERIIDSKDTFSISNHEAFLKFYKKDLIFVVEEGNKSKLTLFIKNKAYRMYIIHKFKMKFISYIYHKKRKK